MSWPMDSRRKTYCPPARGYIAASSPSESAPKIVITPVTIHAISSQKGEPTVREISAETMKMPDPIIEPATSIVASVSVSALTNSRDDGAVSAVAVVDVKAYPLLLGSRGPGPPALRAEVTAAGPILPGNGRDRLRQNTNPGSQFVSENDLDFGGVALGCAVRMHARPESHRTQHLGHPSVVVAIARGIESDQFRISLLVDVEERLH